MSGSKQPRPKNQPGDQDVFLILGPENPLQVVPRMQEGYYTCWSTSAEMIMDFLGRHVRQCEQAAVPGTTASSCCGSDGLIVQHPDCDFPHFPEFERWGFTCKTRPASQPLSWDDIVKEIDEGRPFAFSWMRSDLSAAGSQVSHMLVVVGYSKSGDDASRMLLCLNPRPFAVADEVVVYFSDYFNNGTTGPSGSNGTINPVSTGGPHYLHQYDYLHIQPASLP
jgi:hypothetical protein